LQLVSANPVLARKGLSSASVPLRSYDHSLPMMFFISFLSSRLSIMSHSDIIAIVPTSQGIKSLSWLAGHCTASNRMMTAEVRSQKNSR